MLEKIGLAALVVLIASESFAFSEAVLWTISALMHLGKIATEGTFVASAIIGLGCGYWILRSALANRENLATEALAPKA